MLTDQVDLVNPKGHQIIPDIRKPLPLGGSPGQVTIQSQYIFNKDQEYLVSGDKGRRSSLSVSKLKAAHYLDFRLEELVPSLWIESEREYDISGAYDISHWWFKRKNSTSLDTMPPLIAVKSDHTCKFSLSSVSRVILHHSQQAEPIIYKDINDQKKMMQETEVHKFSDGTLHRILEKLDHMVKDFRLSMYNPGMTTRIWFKDDKRRSKEFMEVIEHRLKL
uniref:Uncharacterized protein n=1 Tax=Tanacetum cinerariifolium TaxID=118510 RepID=A0A699JY94_TANCI|nr:hypothetical protein [Tanacetum cinerariifolium]GFA65615.1 hypothetical protein [Tanacetum cinerariifolium]